MGGIADYSGSLVLQQTIRAACQVACQVKPARNSTFSAMTMLPTGAERFDCPLDDLTGREAAIQALSSGPDWSSYVGGAVALLFEEKQKDSNPLELRVLVSCSSIYQLNVLNCNRIFFNRVYFKKIFLFSTRTTADCTGVFKRAFRTRACQQRSSRGGVCGRHRICAGDSP